MQLSFIEDTHHRRPGARDVMYILRFNQVTKPIISSRIICFQVEQTNNIVALAGFIFILNISVEQTKFQYSGGSISNRIWPWPSHLTFMTVDNVKSFTEALTYTSSDIHGIWKSICTPIHFFKKQYLAFFLSKIECCNVVSEGIPTSYDIHIVK